METQNDAPETPAPKKEVAPTAIPLSESRALAPTDSQELRRVIAFVADGGGFPKRFDSEAKRIAVYNLANSLMGSRWQLALNNMAEIKGQLTIWGELPGAIAEQTKEVEEKRVFVIDPDYKEICTANKNLDAPLFAGVCQIKRKGRLMKEFSYTLDEAHKAGQLPARKKDGSPNPDSPWEKFTKVMLMRKAMAMGVKFEFPDAMVGVPVAEYDYDEMPDLKDVTPTGSSAASNLNQRFSGPVVDIKNANGKPESVVQQ